MYVNERIKRGRKIRALAKTGKYTLNDIRKKYPYLSYDSISKIVRAERNAVKNEDEKIDIKTLRMERNIKVVHFLRLCGLSNITTGKYLHLSSKHVSVIVCRPLGSLNLLANPPQIKIALIKPALDVQNQRIPKGEYVMSRASEDEAYLVKENAIHFVKCENLIGKIEVQKRYCQ